jgi:lipopolysaccharide biosynthesis glycosyltransferase
MWPLDIYIGWDSREQEAFRVAKDSMFKHTKALINIYPLQQSWLREQGHYWRSADPLASTEFSLTRFLVPHLQEYRGWALFCDCDFLFRRDIAELFKLCDDRYAVMCVKHDYQPKDTHKMDNRVQHQYDRKNWSSLMLINCGHEQVKRLMPYDVNTQTALYLHQFKWLTDDVIGELPVEWNYLEGWHTAQDCADPAAVHFTRGGPWLNNYQNVEYAAEWKRYV